RAWHDGCKEYGKAMQSTWTAWFRSLLFLSFNNRVTGAPVRTRESPGVPGAGPSRRLVAHSGLSGDLPATFGEGASRGAKGGRCPFPSLFCTLAGHFLVLFSPPGHETIGRHTPLPPGARGAGSPARPPFRRVQSARSLEHSEGHPGRGR